MQQRVSEVLTIRLQGAEFADIVQYAAEKQWGVNERQLWNYIQKSDELLAETMEKDREKLFNRHVAQRRALYARCMATSDYSNARGVLKDEAELLGLYPSPADALERSIEGLTKRLAALEKADGHETGVQPHGDAGNTDAAR
jgi:hypothetical protein